MARFASVFALVIACSAAFAVPSASAVPPAISGDWTPSGSTTGNQVRIRNIDTAESLKGVRIRNIRHTGSPQVQGPIPGFCVPAPPPADSATTLECILAGAGLAPGESLLIIFDADPAPDGTTALVVAAADALGFGPDIQLPSTMAAPPSQGGGQNPTPGQNPQPGGQNFNVPDPLAVTVDPLANFTSCRRNPRVPRRGTRTPEPPTPPAGGCVPKPRSRPPCSGVPGLNVLGSQANDIISGTERTDTILGAGGRDSIMAGDDNDYIAGGKGRDGLSGGACHDRIHDFEGARNELFGGRGNDTIAGIGNAYGDAGNDYVLAAGERAFAHGGSGNDIVVISGPTGPKGGEAWGFAGTDTLWAVNDTEDKVRCGDGDDIAYVDRDSRGRRVDNVARDCETVITR